MPIYEFDCPAGHRTEVLMSVREADVNKIPCPTCDDVARRVQSLPATFSDDFAVAKGYEKRKGAEPPIHGSASHPTTEPVSTHPKIFVGR
jgi:putative FmdB family regulatory protein